MYKLFAILLSLFSMPVLGQDIDSVRSIQLSDVIVSSYKEESFKNTSLNIYPLNIDSLSQYGNYNLTDLLAKTPGVTMLSTGIGIAKPVIRGLSGNRIVVLVSGLKFDNQQWQEEHGLGLSDLGLSKVELIKGPMSVLYGSEAMGGIINLIEEIKPKINTQEMDAAIKLNSNTRGGLIQAGYKTSIGNKWFRIRVGVENNADYQDGNNQRVLNSRFDAYYLKSTFGFEKKRWVSTNNFSSSYNRFGFIFNDVYSFVKPDARWSRSLNTNPSHLVRLNMLSSENKIVLSNQSKLNINLGLQSNERMENEGGGAISLNMLLFTFQYLVKWEQKINEHHKLILAHLGSFESNTNFGSRKIIPNANMFETNVSGYLESKLGDKIIFENGIGIGNKWIKTSLTPSVNSAEKTIHPFLKTSVYYNLFSGVSFIPNQQVNFKLNIATGVRIPNLAELSSNGLHEGVFTYEVGDPNLKNEQSISLNLLANISSRYVDFYVSPFINQFINYVYLAPTNEQWFGFPVYRYKQQNAKQFGTELNVVTKPFLNVQLGVSYSGMMSKTGDGNYTPFIPAQKISPMANYSCKLGVLKSLRIVSNIDYCFPQNNTYPNEIATPSYLLWNMGLSSSFNRRSKQYNFSITANNILNAAYYDHLSRFKNFGLLNIGRNIVLMLKVNLYTQTKR